MSLNHRIKSRIRDVEDFPKPGIVFKDITPLLADPGLIREIIQALANPYRTKKIDAVAAVEARGFIFGSLLSQELDCSFIPVRKAGKLPFKSRKQQYSLEYGSAEIEIHIDAIEPGWRVLVHDDLLATGGTASATGHLIKSFDAEVAGFSFLVNLSFLSGEKNLAAQFGMAPDFLIKY
ncbi:MAG: adenine phosphoribosyltransferase [Cyclobacteriaceae bacterium]